MKAMVYHQYGSPDVLKMEQVEMPAPDDDEVLVKIYAVSINAWDWDYLTGKPLEYRLLSGLLKPKSSKLHGCDIAGKVEKVGKNVTRFQVGDDVLGDLSEGGWGAFAEYRCIHENELTPKPASMTFADAACLPHGGNLAVQGLIDIGNIKSGQKILIIGGAGSTGTLAIQIAKLFDTEVTAVDHTEKLDFMRALGADHVLDYTQEDFTQTGRQYDLIFDMKTNRSMFEYRRALRPNGVYVTVGGQTSRLLQIGLFGRLMRQCSMRILGYKANKDTRYLIELVEAGKLKPVVDKCFSLAETADAFRYFGTGRYKGKIVVKVDQPN
ncbi:NAD(P)-dependent alcohol dehydrogenase [Marinomonas piezotolerans]|uniref:NAD(P)-dependent alcohol dehydrogenase n=1 Tax=Marinomonas piezotolerans TaxID=2213058 RepID=A0A370UBB1_9GAMM|nr:NAD(P)-dependent alcohol dehydrogenase [Marinomonas piezotolerans]RDL45074.1 NAD(P)-dependent alcohol dehydrogenase [Marinomonas piezotolerans]